MIRFTINHTKGESIISVVLKNIPSIVYTPNSRDLSSLTIAKLHVQNDEALIVVLIWYILFFNLLKIDYLEGKKKKKKPKK